MTAERDGDQPYAFICHSHRDRDQVGALVTHLNQSGIPTWYDKKVPDGERWTQVLTRKIASCAAVVVVMSPRAAESEFVEKEIAKALRDRIRIFPLLLEGNPFETLDHLQYSPLLPDGRPTDTFVRSLRAAVRRPWWRRTAVGVAAAALVLVAVVVIAVLLRDGPDAGRTTGPGASGGTSLPRTQAGTGVSGSAGRPSEGACGGLPARITAVSTESPGHTGLRPKITVAVCTAPASGHEYWLMNYVLEDIEPAGQARVFYTKVRVDGAAGRTGEYQVIHSDATEAGSVRFYLVVDVPPDLTGAAATHSQSDAGRPVGRDEQVPPGTTLVSNEWRASL
jgi:hypothetical protein